MAIPPSTWKPVQLSILEQLANSGQTCLLPKQYWPVWAHRSTQFEQIWIHCPNEHERIKSDLTTAEITARLITERFDIKDDPKPLNYNYYLLVRTTDGQVFQSGPLRTSDILHHSSERSSDLDAYGPPTV